MTPVEYVRVRGMNVSYRRNAFPGSPRVPAVRDVSFQINKGECFALVGESGSGKSTIAKALLGLVPMDSGMVRIGRYTFPPLPRRDRKPFRREVQVVFQDPFLALNPRLSVSTLIEEPLAIHGVPRKERPAAVQRVLERVRLDPDCLSRRPSQLSGGQRQRVCIARSLILRPTFLIADEPVSSLDLSVQASIIDLLIDLKEKEGLTLLLVSHDMDLVRFVADRVGVLYAGRLVEIGRPDELFAYPLHPYTASLLQSVPSRLFASANPLPEQTRLHRLPPALEGCPYRPNCEIADMNCRYRFPPLVTVSPTHSGACSKIRWQPNGK